MSWDPEQYARYAAYRSRPFDDLTAAIHVQNPRRVVDLGCGTGELTARLTRRWPDAEVIGIDSSPDMVAGARSGPGLPDVRRGDLADFAAGGVDVVVSNAALQWVPSHLELLARWAGQLPPGGAIAWQVPGNFDAPSHALMRELAEGPRWQDTLGGVLRHRDAVATPAVYQRLLLDAGLDADVWETSYLHLLAGDDPVLEWVRGTGLRPVLDALGEADAAEFVGRYREMLRGAYPPGPHGTVFPFRRIFCVGHT